MSTRDMEAIINDSFKLTDEEITTGYYQKIGHYMPLVAEVHPEYTSEYGTTFPHVGSLVIINDDDQSWQIPCNIQFEYETAVLSGYTDGRTANGDTYDSPVYSESSGYTGFFTIPTGVRRFKQHLFTGSELIHNVKNVSINDPAQTLRMYILGDDGIKLLYGMENEHNRDILDKVTRSLFVAPPVCVLCDGVGTYEGSVCSQCGGNRYIGYNAEGWLLTNKARELGVTKRDETERSFQHRAWAEKQWVNPTVSGIINYVHLITGFPKDEIEVTQSTGYKELKYYVRFPLGQGGTAALDEGGASNVSDSFVFSDTQTIQDLIDDISPAGTNAIIEPYYTIIDSSVMDYRNGYTTPTIMGTNNRKWYAKWTDIASGEYDGTGWITSGEHGLTWDADGTGFAGTGYTQNLKWHCSCTSWDTTDPYYTGITSGEFDSIYKLGSAYRIGGTTGWATGEQGFYITGTTGYYKT